MIRAMKFALMAVILIPIAAIMGLLLFWLGRPDEPRPPAVVADFDPDDSGLDVDEDERTP